MGLCKKLFFASFVLGVAIFVNLDMFEPQLQKIWKLANTCPLHWFNFETPSTSTDGYQLLSSPSDSLFTKDELAEYHGGEDSKGLYLAVLGRVYDVKGGERFYAEGGGYSFFRAKDGTKAFMTGEFNEEGLVDEVTGLTSGQMIELEDWIKFYDKSYVYKGKLVGNFYNEKGEPTEAVLDAVRKVAEAREEKDQKEAFKKKFPPCNSSWKQGRGKKLWCSEKSGGVKRDWVGVPRQYFSAGSTAGKCVCVRTTGPPSDDRSSKAERGDLDNPNVKEYEGCEPDSPECYFSEK